MASSRPPAGSDGDVAALAARADCENAAPLRVAVLNCEDAVKWADHVDVLRCAYGSPGDAWTEYRCYDGEFPSDGDLDALDAVVCPGSRHSANDDALPWVAGLLDEDPNAGSGARSRSPTPRRARRDGGTERRRSVQKSAESVAIGPSGARFRGTAGERARGRRDFGGFAVFWTLDLRGSAF